MARRQVLVLLIFLVALSVPAAGLDLQVKIADFIDQANYELSYSDDVESLQQVNMTVENLGSIGCEYRLETVFNTSESEEVHYSKPKALWPGDTATMKVNYVPGNFSGEVYAENYLTYCGRQDLVGNFSFQVDSPASSGEGIVSREESANSTKAVVNMDVEDGILVPEDVPTGWKASSTQIDDGKATVEYEAPIFDPEENITYTVVRPSGEIEGRTEVSLDVEPTLVERLRANSLKILLALSVLLNLVLFATRDSLKTKIKALK